MLVLVTRVVPELSFKSDSLHRVKRVRTSQRFLSWMFCEVCINNAISLGEIWLYQRSSCVSGPVGVVLVEPGTGDMYIEAKTKGRRRWISTVITRRLVRLSKSEAAPIDHGCRESSCSVLEQAFDNSMYHFKLGCFQCRSMAVPQFWECCFRPFFCQSCYNSHQCNWLPAGYIVPVHLRGGEGADSWTEWNKWVLSRIIHVYSLSHFPGMFCCLKVDDVLSRLEQVELEPSHVVPRPVGTSDTSGYETNVNQRRGKLRSKRTYKRTRARGGRRARPIFRAGPTDLTKKPSHLYFSCAVSPMEVSVLTLGTHEILRHFQGTQFFHGDHCLRLTTPGWQLLDIEISSLSSAELERQRDRIMRAPVVIWDREYFLSEGVGVAVSGAVDPSSGVMPKVFSLMEVVRLGGSYELVCQLSAEFTSSAEWVNLDLIWARDEVLVGILTCSIVCTYPFSCIYFVACSMHYSWLDVTSDFVKWC